MKPVLLLIAVYTLIYQQYRKRTHHKDLNTEVVSTPLPQPTPARLSEADSVSLESPGTHKSLTTAAFIQVLPVQ